MINWFDMPAEGLSNGGLFEVKELEVTENGTYETKGEMYNKVTVNVEGGGSSWQTVFEGSVTTVAEDEEYPSANVPELATLSADTIRVTLNGVEYTCEKIEEDEGIFVYGDDTFTEYPFFISINPRLSTFNTQTAGTYTLKIEEEQSGGGDFSTAEVTIVVAPTFRENLTWNFAYILDFPGAEGGMSNGDYIVKSESSPDIKSAILYKGNASLYAPVPSDFNLSISGNITDDGDDYYIITGDCTITIS